MNKFRRRERRRQMVGTLALCAGLACAGAWLLLTTPMRVERASAAVGSMPATLPATRPSVGWVGIEPRLHDPCIAKDGRNYYVYSTGTGIPAFRSGDLIHWTRIKPVFEQVPQWATDAILKGLPENGHRPTWIWAPDVTFYRGEYSLYYCVSTFGSNHSVIGLATNKTLDPESSDYRWVDHGKVVESTRADHYNAIDPNLVIDAAGNPWLTFGSFWSGIKLRKLDGTGMPDATDATVYALATRPEETGRAIEGPSLVYREGYYYLFVAFDLCCRGAESTYRVMVGRSKSITGPYVDKAGVEMLTGGGSPFLVGDPKGQMRGPGGATVMHDGERWLIADHFYDAEDRGASKLQVREVTWDGEGWPVAGEAMGNIKQ